MHGRTRPHYTIPFRCTPLGTLHHSVYTTQVSNTPLTYTPLMYTSCGVPWWSGCGNGMRRKSVVGFHYRQHRTLVVFIVSWAFWLPRSQVSSGKRGRCFFCKMPWERRMFSICHWSDQRSQRYYNCFSWGIFNFFWLPARSICCR